MIEVKVDFSEAEELPWITGEEAKIILHSSMLDYSAGFNDVPYFYDYDGQRIWYIYTATGADYTTPWSSVPSISYASLKASFYLKKGVLYYESLTVAEINGRD